MDKKENEMHSRLEEFKMEVQSRANGAWTWAREHKNDILKVAPALIAAVVEFTKMAAKASDRREDRETFTDPEDNVRLKTKRPLTKEDYREMRGLRKQKGMTTGEALDDMGLLK